MEAQAPLNEESLPIGTYPTGKTVIQDFYDATTDEMLYEVEVAEMLAIRPAGKLPDGVISARYREDGCRVIHGWALTDAAKAMVDYHQRMREREIVLVKCKDCYRVTAALPGAEQFFMCTCTGELVVASKPA